MQIILPPVLCGEGTLREWWEIYIEHDAPVGQLKCSYECHCWECNWKWSHNFPLVSIPAEAE